MINMLPKFTLYFLISVNSENWSIYYLVIDLEMYIDNKGLKNSSYQLRNIFTIF